jgi:hypothetical protein
MNLKCGFCGKLQNEIRTPMGAKKIAFAQRAKATQQNHYITQNM